MVTNRVLIPFNMLYDTEMGLINLIGEKYMDPEEFEDGLIIQPHGINYEFLKERPMKNPLGEYTVKEEDADFYYKEFMEKKYNEILEYAEPTAILDMVKHFIKTNGAVTVTVICSTEEEYDIIDKNLGEFNFFQCILVKDYKEIDLKNYDTIYIKDITDLLLFEQSLDGKKVYIASYYHNFTFGLEEPVLDVRVTTLLLSKAEVSIIDLYAEEDYIICEG